MFYVLCSKIRSDREKMLVLVNALLQLIRRWANAPHADDTAAPIPAPQPHS